MICNLEDNNFAFLPGYSDAHHHRLLTAYTQALASGTWKNKATHIAKFVKFMRAHNADPKDPQEYDILSYILHLQTVLTAPSSVHNYLSSVRTWLKVHARKEKVFESYRVVTMRRAVGKAMMHSPVQAEPLTKEHLAHVVKVLDGVGKPALVIKAVILLAYATLLRSSNLLPVSERARSPHLLGPEDISVTDQGLEVRVQSSKTIRDLANSQLIIVRPDDAAATCPVKAWKDYKMASMIVAGSFTFIRMNRRPLTLPQATMIVRRALHGSTFKKPANFTFHSLRRGGAQACARAGASLAQIKQLGNWRSSAVHTYVPIGMIQTASTTLNSNFG